MRKHVANCLLFGGAIIGAIDGAFASVFKPREELTLDDPQEMWFPELEFNDKEKAAVLDWENLTNHDQRGQGSGKILELYEAKVDALTEERKKEFYLYEAKVAGKKYGKMTERVQTCDALEKVSGRWNEKSIMSDFFMLEMDHVMWVTPETYTKYIYNRPDQPWLIFFLTTPRSKNTNHLHNQWNQLRLMWCAAKEMGLNFGLFDHNSYELLMESFFTRQMDYGMGVPYYVYTHKGKAVHLAQKLYRWEVLVKEIENAQKGEGIVVERTPRLIFWPEIYIQYAIKGIGDWFSRNGKDKYNRYVCLRFGQGSDCPGWEKYHELFWIGKVGQKPAGWNAIRYIICPLLGLTYIILSGLWSCICSKKKEEPAKEEAAKDQNTPATASPTKKGGKKRAKVE